jgi:hypothetical protein
MLVMNMHKLVPLKTLLCAHQQKRNLSLRYYSHMRIWKLLQIALFAFTATLNQLRIRMYCQLPETAPIRRF